MGSMIFGVIGLLILAGLLALILLGVYLLFKKIVGDNLSLGQTEDQHNLIAKLKDSLMVRIALAALLMLISFIPLGFVANLADERGYLYESVAYRMTEEWGGDQRIAGPILSIPYQYTTMVTEKVTNTQTGAISYIERPVTRETHLVILPENLDITTELETTELSRGIYSVPIYDSTHLIQGHFKWPDLSILSHQPEQFLWERASLAFMITSTRGIAVGTELQWQGQLVDLSPGTGLSGNNELEGVHVRLKLDPSFQATGAEFQFNLNLRGSKGIEFAPTGRQSNIRLEANWPHPSFIGALLPNNRHIADDGFSADWQVTHLSRSYSQMEALNLSTKSDFFSEVYSFALGVDFFQSVDLYTLLDRTIKYGILFIALTFFSVFIMEFTSGIRLHWLQHLILGAALSMFYLCVLALSEHLDFGYAYLIGVSLIAAMIGIYTSTLMGKINHGLSISGVMIALYAVLYSILQMEDYALLIGTFLLLIFLGLGMVTTRKLHQQS